MRSALLVATGAVSVVAAAVLLVAVRYAGPAIGQTIRDITEERRRG